MSWCLHVGVLGLRAGPHNWSFALLCLSRGDTEPTEAFGASITPADEWTAADCIRGNYSVEDQMPDADLGKSVSKGYRNFTTDPHRVFGVPTIRNDIPAKAKASVADHQNYGNDADAASLLHPSRFAPIGVGHRCVCVVCDVAVSATPHPCDQLQ